MTKSQIFRSFRISPDGPIAEYDFGWMWAELGLQDHRK
jgi:hypothetical protein